MAYTPQAGTGDSVSRFRRYHWSTLINYNSNLSMCGTFLKKLLPPPADNCWLRPTPKKTYDLNLSEVTLSIWSFHTPRTIFRAKQLYNPGLLPSLRSHSQNGPEKNRLQRWIFLLMRTKYSYAFTVFDFAFGVVVPYSSAGDCSRHNLTKVLKDCMDSSACDWLLSIFVKHTCQGVTTQTWTNSHECLGSAMYSVCISSMVDVSMGKPWMSPTANGSLTLRATPPPHCNLTRWPLSQPPPIRYVATASFPTLAS